MKTTLNISDDLFEKAQQLAKKEKTTFRALTETGLRMVIAEKKRKQTAEVSPLVTYGQGGLTPEFANADWDKIRKAAYQGHGS